MKQKTSKTAGASGTKTDTLDSVADKIKSLSELFSQWFLLYSMTKSNSVGSFIADNKLSNLISASDFLDLIHEGAYLDEQMVKLIPMLLPFKISDEKMQQLNNIAYKTGIRMIESDSEVADKILQELTMDPEQKRLIKYREYYKANREHILEYRKEYRQRAHVREKRKEINRKYRTENKDKASEYQKKYRRIPRVQEHISEYNRNYFIKNRERLSARRKEYLNRPEVQEHRKQHTKEYNRERYAFTKQRDNAAKSVCPTFLYLLQMRHDHRADYLKLLGRRDLVSFAITKCPALQSMNSEKCIICNGETDSYENCAMQQMAEMPKNIVEVMPKFIAIIKQKSKTK